MKDLERQSPSLLASLRLPPILHLECGHVKFALASLVIHIANFAENRAFFPALIVGAANAPHAADEAVGAATVDGKMIVEVDGNFQSFGRRRRPLQNLLSPIHSENRWEVECYRVINSFRMNNKRGFNKTKET